MTPVKFPEANSVLLAGEIPDCGDLPTFKDGTWIISKWRMTWRERLSALVFGTAFVYVMAPITSPPVAVSVARNVFRTTEKAGVKVWGDDPE